MFLTSHQLLSGSILSSKYHKSSTFQNDFLTLDYEGKKIVVLVVQDRNIGYKIQLPYSDKVKGIHCLLTRPEIEMLMILALGEVSEYEKVKSLKKPSIFLQDKHSVKGSILKSKDYIEEFYKDHDLVAVIREHKRITKAVKGHHFLADILK